MEALALIRNEEYHQQDHTYQEKELPDFRFIHMLRYKCGTNLIYPQTREMTGGRSCCGAINRPTTTHEAI
jgi:hypothetical protein